VSIHTLTTHDSETSFYPVADAVPRVQVGHALVHSCSFDEMLDAIVGSVYSGEPQYVVTPNAQHVVLLAGDKHLRTTYADAAFVLPDGISLILAGRFLGQNIQHRISGVDMFEALCRRAAREGMRVFLLGGRPGSAEKAVEKLLAKSPGLIISGICCPPMGFENDPVQQGEVEAQIRAARPHLLFVALGAPKQEYWMYEHSRSLGVPIAMGVGGSFEMVGGIVNRAPGWVQNMGIEWLYRLVREPRRLWRRYLIGNVQFGFIVLRQWLRLRRSSGNSFESGPVVDTESFRPAQRTRRRELRPLLDQERAAETTSV
jgi:N-acetylglucosaminyldiphosphoundecaprenol N-acetyl-beta-D-mannosaminyltransferase